jgi:hypothetical protein
MIYLCKCGGVAVLQECVSYYRFLAYAPIDNYNRVGYDVDGFMWIECSRCSNKTAPHISRRDAEDEWEEQNSNDRITNN